MNSNLLSLATRNISGFVAKNSPSLLTGLGVSGFIGTIFFAVEATKKATSILLKDEFQAEQDAISENFPLRKSTKLDHMKMTWKCYIPTAVLGVASISCFVAANSIHLRRNAALASVYAFTETALKEYQAKVVETIGEKKEELIRGNVAQDKLNANPIEGNSVIVTGKGTTLCYDALSGRYFESDMETLRKIQNDCNARLLQEMSMTLNEFYDEIGLEHTKMGHDNGWAIGLEDATMGLIDLYFTAKIATDGRPCIVINYRVGPRELP